MRLASAFCGVLLCWPASAQTARVRGSVRGLDGKPWAGAAVVLRSRLPGDWRRTLRAKTDERGRFAVDVRPAELYSVFAHTAPAGGKYRVTRTVDPVTAGQRVLLIELEERPLVRVALGGLEAWKGRGLRFFSGTELFVRDGVLTVPPQARRNASISICNPRGVQLHALYTLEPGPDGTFNYELPEPTPVRLSVVDAAGEPAIAAVVRAFHGTGQTAVDERGGLDLEVPLQPAAGGRAKLLGLRFGVAAPGSALVQSASFYDQEVAAGPVAVRVDLEAGRSFRGRVVGPGGAALTGATVVQWTNEVIASKGRKSRMIGGPPRLVTTDAGGRFTTPGADPRYAARLGVRLDDALIDAVGRSKEYPTYPVAFVAFVDGGRKNDAGDVELGDLRLDRLAPVDIAVTRSDGAPARFATVLAGRPDGPGWLIRMVTDRHGRVRVLLPKTEKIFVGAGGDAEIVVTETRVAGARELELRLVAGLYVAGTVVDAKGEPLPGVSVMSFGAMRTGHGKERLAGKLGASGAVTDAKGRFKVRVAGPDRQVQLLLMRGSPGSRGFVNLAHRVTVDDAPRTDVRIVIPEKR